MKRVKFLVMSVGPYEKNGTCKYFEKIGGIANTVVVLPKQFEANANGYREHGIAVYIYDESKYINGDFEFFGFKQRNCGGVGRQGIAEAVDALNDGNTIFCEVDDDTAGFAVRKRTDEKQSGWRATSIRNFSSLEKIINLLDEFYHSTGIKIQGKTGATITGLPDYFFANRKIFNNFIMSPDDAWRGDGFKALCSDDVRYNICKSLNDCTQLASIHLFAISFTQNQGDRKDGNAPLYNKDCSWKKSMANRMYNPLFGVQYVAKEKNRILFRETMHYSKLYPPIMLSDKDGNIVARLKIN